MAKNTVKFVCNNCGALHGSWMGRCTSCGEWNTLVESLGSSQKASGHKLSAVNLESAISVKLERIKSGDKALDEVLGGGFVPGSVTLIAGQPGIGKSTLLLQVAMAVASGAKVLYVSGEESAEQVGMRATRLGLSAKLFSLVSSNSTDDIAATIAGGDYELVVVDSIQTVSLSSVASASGSVAQITNSAHVLIAAAKRSNTALLLVGHVTKEGSIAGPKVLEHVVDVVLQLEGDRYTGFKLLRSIKNRYGSTNESAIYEMLEKGLKIVDNPSAALLAERQVSDGSVVLATLEGHRPVLVEVQALVNHSSYGYPKRTASGMDINRLNLLIAVLEKRTRLNFSDKDVYVNIVGGLKITEPAADLAICMAIASASKGMQLKKDAVVYGEVGLSGEIRRVTQTEKRLQEAEKMGFIGAIGPNQPGLKSKFLLPVGSVREALLKFLEKD